MGFLSCQSPNCSSRAFFSIARKLKSRKNLPCFSSFAQARPDFTKTRLAVVVSPSFSGLQAVLALHSNGTSHTCRPRSEEHTSELQSRGHLVCRLLLEKNNRTKRPTRACNKKR